MLILKAIYFPPPPPLHRPRTHAPSCYLSVAGYINKMAELTPVLERLGVTHDQIQENLGLEPGMR